MIDPKEILQVAEAALERAKQYFLVDPSWDVRLTVMFGLDSPAQVELNSKYKIANVRINAAAETLEDVWVDVGHEVSHIVIAEFDVAFQVVSPFIKHPERFHFITQMAEERTAMQLEGMWERDNPFPGVVRGGGEE